MYLGRIGGFFYLADLTKQLDIMGYMQLNHYLFIASYTCNNGGKYFPLQH